MSKRRKNVKVKECRDLENMKLVETLPDEIWVKIFEIGLENSILNHTDLCALSISSKHFNTLSNADTLWSILLTQDFPTQDHISSSSQPLDAFSTSKKNLYKFKAKLRFDSYIHELNQIRSDSRKITRQLKQFRCRLTKRKERWEALQEYADDQDTWYRESLEKIDNTEEMHNNVKKRISKKHAYYKKKSRKFHMFCVAGEGKELGDYAEGGKE